MSTAPGVRLKGSTLRSYVSVLTRDGHRDAVLAQVPPDTAAQITDPPLATAWVDFVHVVRITQAVEALYGTVGVREFARKAIDDAKKPHLRVLEAVMRLFGVSPASVFKRLNDVIKHTIENNIFSYAPTSDRSGVMEVRWLVDYEVPTCMFIGVATTFQVIFESCGVRGFVGAPERLGPGAARFRLQW
jgi:hypothetical protein